MPHPKTVKRDRRGGAKTTKSHHEKAGPRYTVGLSSPLAHQVKRYAQTADTSMSKAIAALVRLGLEGQENRKQKFFKKLKENLAGDDPTEQDRLVDEFRALVLGR